MMRKEMYEAVKAAIEAEVPEVRHVDLWNRNVEFIEQEDGWERPAVFVEFGTIAWEPFKNRVQRGKGVVRIHVVTDWNEGGQASAWGISHKIYAALDGLKGDTFNGMAIIETATNHNHEEILESIDSYAVRFLLTE